MLWSLKRKLPILFVAVSLISVIIVSIVTNITIQKQFDKYMQTNQDKRNSNIVESLSTIYKANGGWSESAVYDIMRSPTFRDINIKVKDMKGNIVFELDDVNQMMGHMPMMRMVGEYTEKSFPITVENTQVGYADIGYYGPLSLTVTDLSFISSINGSILSAAVISALSALILSFILARGLTVPIINLKVVANKIKNGDLKARYKGPVGNQEIAELSSTINGLAESLQQQESIRRRMTSDIAHEFRTPLTTLRSHLEAVMDGVWEMTPDHLNSCYEEVVRLSKLVKNLEQLNRLENDMPAIEKSLFNLGSLVSSLVESFKPMLLEKDLSIITMIEPDVEITADRDKISQIVINLLSNAHKYTHPGGRIVVAVKKDKKNAYIIVRDTGMGISEQDLPHIFDRFYRGEKSRSRETGGSGIGLTIAKAIVDAHAGTINVKSELNKGSEFEVSLPLKN